MRPDAWIRLGLVAVIVAAEAAYFLSTGNAAPGGFPRGVFVGLLVAAVLFLGAYGWLRAAWIARRLRREPDSEPERRRLQRLLDARARGVMHIDEVQRRWREGEDRPQGPA